MARKKRVRDYKEEYKYHGTEEQKANRSKRNAARREAEAEGKVKKGDGKEVSHRKPLSKGGSNAKSNLYVTSRTANRKNGTKDLSTKKKGK